MNHRTIVLATLCSFLALGAAPPAAALDAGNTDPHAILQAVAKRPTGDRAVSRVKMTIRDGAGSRERVMHMRGMNFAGGKKTLIMFESPSEVRNTGFLSIHYSGRKHPDEQWLYLPNLQRVTRVPAGGRSGSFMSSDFTYQDLADQDFQGHELKLVDAQVKVGDDDCWVIEATPPNDEIRNETGYSKLHLWISKQKLAPLQIKAWLLKGQKTKYIKASNFERIDDVWTPRRLQAKTLRDTNVESETTIEVLSTKYGAPEVTDADFTPRRLERGL